MANEIIKVLDELGKRFGIAIDWSAENVLPYIEDLGTRFIMYRNYMAILWIFISIIMFVSGIVLVRKIVKYMKSDNYDEYDDAPWLVLLCILVIALFIAAPIVFFQNTTGIIQNVCMPEITIVNYIKELTTIY